MTPLRPTMRDRIPADPSVERARYLWVALHRTSDAVYKVREKELHRFDLSVEQAGILAAVKFLGPRATPAEIARWVSRAPNSVSTLVSRMESNGLVTKVNDLGRKNLKRIALTAKGEAAHRRVIPRESIINIIASLSEEEQQQLQLILRKLRTAAFNELGIDLVPP